MKKRRTVAHRTKTLALLAVTFALAAVSCTTPIAETPGELRASEVAANEYQVQPGDRLFISVWREETLQREVIVRPDGGIRFPLAGEVKAAGHSVAEIEHQLKKKLSNYIPDPAISVSLLQSTGHRIYVIGRVVTPGEYVLSQNVDIMKALALAGGVTPFADRKKIKVVRNEKGTQRVFNFNYKEVEKGVGLSQNIMLMSGDTVIVP